jgi:hypothetical protein
MTTYVFSYRMPEDYVLGRPESVAKSCPSLEQGGGLEVGVLGEVPNRLQRA